MSQVATSPPGPVVEESASAAPPATLHAVPWRWSDLVIGLAPLVLERAGMPLVPRATLAALPGWAWVVATVAGAAWSLGYPLWVARRRGGRLRLPGPRAILVEGLIALALLPVLFGAIAGFTLLGRNLGIGPKDAATPFDAIARSGGRAEMIALGVLAILVAPIAEEVFFRGMLLGGLRRRLPLVAAVLIQGVLFGLAHPFGVLGMATIALGGCVLGLVAAWRRTLVAPIALHAFQNVVGMLMITANAAAYNAAPTLGVLSDPQEHGQVITQVVPGSAAALGGLQAGDVITAVDGAEFAPGGLVEVIRSHEVGDRVTVQYLRRGQPGEAQVTLKKRQE